MKLCPIRTSRLFRKLLPPLKMLLSALKYWIYCLILVYFQLEKRTRPEGSFVLLIVMDVMVTLMVHGKASSDDIWLADVNAVLDESHGSNARVPQSFSTSADPNKSFEFCPRHQTVPLERSFIIVKSEKLIRLSPSVRWRDFWSGCSCVGLRSYRDKKHLNYHTLFLIFHRQLDLSMHIATASCAIISKQINWAPGSVNWRNGNQATLLLHFKSSN